MSDQGYTHILHVIDYFSRFTWAFLVTSATQEEVIRCLQIIFDRFGFPVAFYTDEGTHFNGMKIQDWLLSLGILWIGAPVGAKRSTRMIEKANDLLERVLKKSIRNPAKWH